ncbi:MAG: aminotransferase class V-fold PLP-dependent enzyme [Calditrichaceae bacterium]
MQRIVLLNTPHKKIYFDNAATSWPKPDCVQKALKHYLKNVGANPGRSGHSASVEAGRILYSSRENLAKLFNCDDPLRIIFTSGITESLNLALSGLLEPGDHVITSSMEHNSMMRPLRFLEEKGIELSVIRCNLQGRLESSDLKKAIRSNTKMIALNHASNVTGTILPIDEAGKICREQNLLLLVDTAQTAGAYPIEMDKNNIDLLAFTGHKSLYGLPGTGGLVIGNRVDIDRFIPLKRGGTGSFSENEQQPDFLPDKFESGTLNFIGLAALNASVNWILETGVEEIRNHEKKLTRHLLNGIKSINDIKIYGPGDDNLQTSTLSFNKDNVSPSDVGQVLDEQYKILCRIGLHCAPAAHKTIGTFPDGTIRFGLGYFNSIEEIDFAINALEEILNAK